MEKIARKTVNLKNKTSKI